MIFPYLRIYLKLKLTIYQSFQRLSTILLDDQRYNFPFFFLSFELRRSIQSVYITSIYYVYSPFQSLSSHTLYIFLSNNITSSMYIYILIYLYICISIYIYAFFFYVNLKFLWINNNTSPHLQKSTQYSYYVNISIYVC